MERSEWERYLEGRVQRLERQVEKLLDPESGIYPKLTGIESRLMKGLLGILAGFAIQLAVILIVSL